MLRVVEDNESINYKGGISPIIPSFSLGEVMAKIVLNDTSGGYNVSAINNNFILIAEALNEAVLWRKNPLGEPNSMILTNLDMNNNDILNTRRISIAEDISFKGISLIDAMERTAVAAREAEGSAQVASTEAALAGQHALASANSAANALESAANASSSADDASSSAAYARTSRERIEEILEEGLPEHFVKFDNLDPDTVYAQEASPDSAGKLLQLDERGKIDVSLVPDGVGDLQTVNNIAPDADKNIQLDYVVTKAEFEAKREAGELVIGASYIIDDPEPIPEVDMLRDHIANFNNPHRTTLSQIVPRTPSVIFGTDVLGNVISIPRDSVTGEIVVGGGQLTVEDVQALLDAVLPLEGHVLDTDNPHEVTAEQIGAITKESLMNDLMPSVVEAVKEALEAVEGTGGIGDTVVAVLGDTSPVIAPRGVVDGVHLFIPSNISVYPLNAGLTGMWQSMVGIPVRPLTEIATFRRIS